MKLSLFSAAPALLLASSAAFAQAPAVAPTPAPAAAAAAAPVAPTTAAAPAAIDVTTPAPAVTTPAPAPTAVASAAEIVPTKPEEPVLLPKLALLKNGWWQPGATLQFWAFGANQAGETQTTLRIRRAELRVKGEFIPKLLGFNVMIDPARALDNNSKTLTTSDGATVSVNNQGAVSILGDFVLTVMSEFADVSVGQFKIPVSLEGSGSAAKLLFPERAVVSRAYGDVRDMGIKIDKKLGKHFYYYAGVFNGEGQNKLDSNKQKDIAGRIEVYPVDGMMVGFVGYAGLNERDSAQTKDRLEADFRLDIAHLLVQAEYIHGWDGPTGTHTKPRREGAGVYAAIGYTFFDKLQPIIRFGYYDPDLSTNLQGGAERTNLTTTDEVTTYDLGLNYYVLGDNAKLQTAWTKYVYKQEPNRGELIISAQAAF